VIARG